MALQRVRGLVNREPETPGPSRSPRLRPCAIMSPLRRRPRPRPLVAGAGASPSTAQAAPLVLMTKKKTTRQLEQKQGIKRMPKMRAYTALYAKCLPDLSLRSLRKNSSSTAEAED